MQTKSIFLLLTAILLIFTAVDSIEPVCFNCHCSTYELDTSISCKKAITDKTSYFTLWTHNISVVQGSDVVLATEVKSHTEKYCWCTDAKLEWNGLFQNSSGRLLTVKILNATKTETGHYWAVLYLSEKFYFSDPIFLNVTGPPEVIPSPPLKVDPKMGALIVGILFVVIMFSGISIHCLKLHKRSLQTKKRKKERMQYDLDRVMYNPNSDYDTVDPLSNGNEYIARREKTSESRIPLARWELQHPTNIIQESDTELPIFGPDPRPPSDLEEEGSASSKSDESIAKSSDSLSSSEESKEDKKEGEEVEVPVKEPSTSNNRVHPAPSSAPASPLIMVPIKDDRFTTERSWYKSLNTEVVSESLLCNKEHAAKKEEKKRRKSMAASQSSLAKGLLRVGDLGSGVFGSNSHLTQDKIDRLTEAHKVLSRNKYRYGMSLPTPQHAGTRPTVMGIFADTVPHNHIPAGATIHITNPDKRRNHVRNIFGDTSAPINYRDRSRSGSHYEKGYGSYHLIRVWSYENDNEIYRVRPRTVQFSDANITKRYNSADDLSDPKPKDKKPKKLKSNLKSKRSHNKNNIEVDGSAPDDYSTHNGSEPRLSSSGSSVSKEEKVVVRRGSAPAPSDQISLPELDLTPASPVPSPVQLNIEPPTPTCINNRFIVTQVDSDMEIDPSSGNPAENCDPLSRPNYWDFSGSGSSVDDCGRGQGGQKRMQHLTVPGGLLYPGLVLPFEDPTSEGIDNRGYWSE
ncbi:uncharacterized protein LOC134811422 isoform X3 [Bolinopsis microptera]|uniref:uncharacterized protein LOC134811422 isoform X3 n=1 Tax=Bolinopsis microptera TaxID=2820187 RepID=UPI003078FB68